MPTGGAGVTGTVPKPNPYGWYKRRLPVLSALPWANGGGGGGASALLIPLVVSVPHKPSRGFLVGGRVPLPGKIGPRPMRPWVIRSDSRRNGSVFRSKLIAAKLNIAGGVLRPWVIRRDYERGGRVFPDRPPLKAPPLPVAGGIIRALLQRWDFERAGLAYAERPIYLFRLAQAPPAVLFDLRTWYAQGRDNEWDSDARFLQWSADVAAFLTKRSGETRQYTMDFSALPELQNANLASVSSVTASALTVGASNVTLGVSALGSDGKSATVWISGGVSGASYKITFTVTIAGGTVLEDFGYLLVEDE